jgi:hypothetical protein
VSQVADGAVAEDGGLEDVGLGIALAEWGPGGLPRQPKALKSTSDGLDAGEGEAGAVALVGGAGQHPGARWGLPRRWSF